MLRALTTPRYNSTLAFRCCPESRSHCRLKGETNMPTKIADSYRRWFDYEIDAHRKTLASLETESRARPSSQTFQKSVDLFAHIIAARRLWLFRLGVSDESPRELFPQAV